VRLTISIDSVPHQIDSTDPVLLGNWMAEIFARAGEMSNATYISAQVYPSFIPDPASPQGMRADWIADTRIVGGVFQVKTPRELVEALARQLDDAEADHG
jgi:hypothetical protein